MSTEEKAFQPYGVHRIDSLDDVRDFFPDGEADALNWCVFSTDGVHGSRLSVDDVERIGAEHITVLIICPRQVRMMYGEILVTPDDVPYLRKLVRTSLAAIAKSQAGNA